MEKQHIEEIENNLEMNEIIYARDLLTYLEEKIEYLSILSRSVSNTKDFNDLMCIVIEITQNASRYTNTFNLIDDLLLGADRKIEASLEIIAENQK